MLVDSHCHLDFPEFAEDMPGVIARAQAAGVTRMVTISTRVAKADTYRAIAEAHPAVWYTVGTHPQGAGEEPDVPAEAIAALTDHPRCIGIGEAGLDYHYEDAAPEAVQERVLRAHIEAARTTGLPLVIHSRDADEHMEAVLRDEMGRGAFKAVLHCFSSGARLAAVGVELGLFVSFSGIVTFRRSTALRDIARAVPRDRLLVETDAPFLAPEPHRGRRCEPAYTADTARSLAETLDLPFADLAALTTANFHRLFDKAARSEAA
ncbi:TatD family hydrolase [Methylobacterium organophilum]|uniref:Metal-dependent hydrolase YcfH n=1 Tax=Methylobacterium organophilum TaxID=410 RepID=A0ABQ4TA22_METOR|nr:TatD family hydrolase [Methylobacterium organophilum]UMY16894.1 TatD family hydrolase [Methylobacterium organophilum]GJE27437.1 putative metal-dependent hydrolase YcfH [Methylobacterium organophilum]